MLSSMLVIPLPPSFLDSYSQYNLCDMRSYASSCHFLGGGYVLWSICWSSSLTHFKNGPDYYTMRTAHVFIPFMRLLPYSLVLSSFLILRRYIFSIFSFKILLLLSLLLYDSLLVFPSSVSWWSFTGVWVTFLFQTIQFSISTQFNCQKHFYFKVSSLVK